MLMEKQLSLSDKLLDSLFLNPVSLSVWSLHVLFLPDKFFLHQGEGPEGTDIQLEELNEGQQHPLSLTVPLQESLSTRFALFTSLFPILCRKDKHC